MATAQDSLTVDEIRARILEAIDLILDRARSENRAIQAGDETAPPDQALADQSYADLEEAQPGVYTEESYKAGVSATRPSAELQSFSVTHGRAVSAVVNLLGTVAGADQLLTVAAVTARNGLSDLINLNQQMSIDFAQLAVLAAAGNLRPPQAADVNAVADNAATTAADAEAAAGNIDSARTRRRAARRGRSEGTSPAGGRLSSGADPVPEEGTDVVFLSSDETRDREEVLNGRAGQDVISSSTTLKEGVLQEVIFLSICSALSLVGNSGDNIDQAQRTFNSIRTAIDSIIGFSDVGFIEGIQDVVQEAAVEALRDIANDISSVVDDLREFVSLGAPSTEIAVQTVLSADDIFPEEDTPIADSLRNFCDLKTLKFCSFPNLIALVNSLQNQGAEQVQSPAFKSRLEFFIDAPDDDDVSQPPPAPDGEVALVLTEVAPAGSFSITVRQRASRRPRIVVPGVPTGSNDYIEGPVLKGGPGRVVLGGEGEQTEVIDYDSSTFDGDTYTINLSAATAEDHGPVLLAQADVRRNTILFKSDDPTLPAKRVKVTHANENIIEAYNGDINFLSHSLSPGDKIILGQDQIPVEIAAVYSSSIELTEKYWGYPTERAVLSLYEPDIEAGSTTFRTRINPAQQRNLSVSSPGKVILGNAETYSIRRDSEGDTFSNVTGIRCLAPIFEPQVLCPGFLVKVYDEAGFVEFKIASVATDRRSCTWATPVDGDSRHLGTVQVVSSGTSLDGTLYGNEIGNKLKENAWVELSHGGFAQVDTIPNKYTATLKTAVSGGDAFNVSAYRTVYAPESAGLRLSFNVSGPLREELEYSSVTPVSGDIFDINLDSPTVKNHRHGSVIVEGTSRTVPQDTEDLVASATPGDLRIDPDVWPVGSTVLKGTLADLSIITDPYRSSSLNELNLPGTIYINGDELRHEGALPINPPGSDGRYEFILTVPTVVSYARATPFEVDALSALDLINEAITADWASPFDDWLSGVAESVSLAKEQLCRMLSGREQDMTDTFAALAVASLTIDPIMRGILSLLDMLLLGAPATTEVDATISELDGAGADKSSSALKTGDVSTFLATPSSKASTPGEAVNLISEHREAAGDFVTAKALGTLQARLHAEDANARLVADFQDGYKTAAKEDSARSIRSVKNLRDEAGKLT